MRVRKILAFVIAAIASVNGWAGGNDHALYLKCGEVILKENIREFMLQPDIAANEIFNERCYKIIQFNEVPGETERKIMEANGIRLLSYLPENAFVASFPMDIDPIKFSQINARSIVPLDIKYKIEPSLYDKVYPYWALKDGNKIDLTVMYQKDILPETMRTELVRGGIEVISSYDFSQMMNVRISIDNIEKFSASPFILWVEAIEPPAEAENLEGATGMRSNFLLTAFPGGKKYDGTGVNVALGDEGTVGPHIDYTGRVDQSSANGSIGDHGDHCVGAVAGAGNLDPVMRGMAPGANMWVYTTYDNSVSSWAAVNDVVNSYGNNRKIRVTSTSYGDSKTTCNNGYTAQAVTSDQHIRQMPLLMHFYTSGNMGTSGCSSNGYGGKTTLIGWANLTGGRKQGKNTFTIGSVSNSDAISSFSSRGPTDDGRIKPDVMSMGESVWSTSENNTYSKKTGTSHACPSAAGFYAQFYHAAMDLNGGQEQESALLKAVVMNAADDVGNAGPDFKSGFGRINGRRALEILEGKTYTTSTVAQGASNTHNITIPSGTKQVKVMVYWTDYEGTALASKVLVNDLDMMVKDPAAKSYSPWILDTVSKSTNLDKVATRGADHINNVEQVTIDDPAAGLYTVTITGNKVPQGPQKYYLVYCFIKDEIVVTYPYGGESFVPGETEIVRWDAWGSSGTFTLEYSTDNGSSWTTLSSAVTATSRSYNWTVPSTVTGSALLRVSRGSLKGASKEKFSIIPVPINLKIAWACSTIFRLQWDAVAGATSYEVSKLGSKYMDAQGTTANTYFDISNGVNATSEFWVSVKAMGPNGCIGRRAIAIKKSPGVFSCPPNASVYENEESSNILLFPNPNNGTFLYTIKDVEPGKYTLSVCDVQGKRVYEEKLSLSSDINKSLDLSSLAKGIYVFKIENEGTQYRKRLVMY